MFCSKCGAAMAEDAGFCAACGSPVIRVSGALVAAGGAAAVAVVEGTPAAVTRYAGFWLRLVAYFVDGMLLMIVVAPLYLILVPAFLALRPAMAALGSNPAPDQIFALMAPVFQRLILISVVGIVVQWLYYAACESSAWQATPGKKLLDLRVSDTEGRRIGFGRASGRVWAIILLGFVPLGFVGYILAGFTERKQALQDIIAGCLVLRGR